MGHAAVKGPCYEDTSPIPEGTTHDLITPSGPTSNTSTLGVGVPPIWGGTHSAPKRGHLQDGVLPVCTVPSHELDLGTSSFPLFFWAALSVGQTGEVRHASDPGSTTCSAGVSF